MKAKFLLTAAILLVAAHVSAIPLETPVATVYAEPDGSVWEETNDMLGLQREEDIRKGTPGCPADWSQQYFNNQHVCIGGRGTSEADCQAQYGAEAGHFSIVGACTVPLGVVCPIGHISENRGQMAVCVRPADHEVRRVDTGVPTQPLGTDDGAYYVAGDLTLWEETNGVTDLQQTEGYAEAGLGPCPDGWQPASAGECSGPWGGSKSYSSDADCQEDFGPDARHFSIISRCYAPRAVTCPEGYTAETRNGEGWCVVPADTRVD